MASDTCGGELPTGDRQPRSKQLQVLLTLQAGERSFGMSLAQRQPALGSKFTVVSSIFPDSPAARAGVREGCQRPLRQIIRRCVVLRINDKPMSGLTVAQVASHFRNVPQTRITLEIHESEKPQTISGFTPTAAGAASTGFSVLAAASVVRAAEARTGRQQAQPTGFAVASSGRAIAAPGSALAIPGAAAPKPQVLRLNPKAAAKSMGPSQSKTGKRAASATTETLRSAALKLGSSIATSSADAKVPNGKLDAKFKSMVTPVLRLGSKPKPVVLTDGTRTLGSTPAKPIPAEPSTKNRLDQTNCVPASKKEQTRSRIPQSPVKAIEVPAKSASAPVTQARDRSLATAGNSLRPPPQNSTHPAVPAPAVVPVPLASAFQTTPAPRHAVLKPIAPKPAASEVRALDTPIEASAKKSTGDAGTFVITTSPLPPSMAKHVATVPATTSQASAHVENGQVSVHGITSKPIMTPAAVKSPVEPVKSSISTPSPIATTVATSAPAPASIPVSSPAKPKTGKKRGRPRKNAAASNTVAGMKAKGKTKAKAKAKAKAQQPQFEEMNLDAMDDDTINDVFLGLYQLSDSDEEESPKKTARRKGDNRRRGSAERHRHSLTIDRLTGMGFTKEDAEASVKQKGDDVDACMVWIISKIEERQFNEDLNRASIQSEESKRDEEKRVKKQEKETLAHAEGFVTLFPTSYMLSPESPATHLKNTLNSTIDQVKETYLRETIGKLLKLESQAIRWYKKAARSYMLELAARLEKALGMHDVLKCCARVSTRNATSCAFVQTLLKEEKALMKALFDMPENQGGVPMVFLQCDEAMKFSLDDDGFEVI